MAFLINQTIDVQQENTPKVYEQALEYGDKNAHTWRVVLKEGGKKPDMTGLTAMLTFKRAAGPAEIEQDPTLRIATVEYPAVVDAANGVAWCTFKAACYGGVGNAVATMKLMDSETVLTSAVMIMTIQRNTSDAVIDPTNMLPSVDELLAQIGAMKTATDAANEAAQEAQRVADEVAGRAPYIGDNGRWYVWNDGLGAYADSGVSATGPTGAAGADGADGADGIDGQTPYIGSNGNWWIGNTDTGTAAQGPAGENGTGSGTVTGVKIGDETYAPDTSGVVDMSGMTAPDANQLNGKDAKYYIQPRNLLDNSDFGIAQVGYNAYHGTYLYLADRWIASHPGSVTLTKHEDYVTLATAENYQYAYQLVNVSALTADTYTFAFKQRSTAASQIRVHGVKADGTLVVAVEKYYNGTGDWITMLVNFNRTDVSDCEKIRCIIYNFNAGSADYKEPVLYPGIYTADNLPPYVAPDPVVELAKCQRYCYPIPTNYSAFAYPGYTIDDNKARITVQTPVPMQETPSLFFPEGEAKMNVYTAETNASVSAAQVETAQGCGVEIAITANSTIPGWAMCTARFSAPAALVADLK